MIDLNHYTCEKQDIDNFQIEYITGLRHSRSILLKPNLGSPYPHPITTSIQTLNLVLFKLCDLTTAEIILLEGPCYNKHLKAILHHVEIPCNRVRIVDVRDCSLVRVQNPLEAPFALNSFLIPSVALECDYRISLASYKIYSNLSSLSIKNMVGILPVAPYSVYKPSERDYLHHIGIHKVIADLYFTFPVDLGIVDARERLIGGDSLNEYFTETWGKVYVGSPLEVDQTIMAETDTDALYIRLISEMLQPT